MKISSAPKEIWNVVRVVRATQGFALGLFLYTYNVFLYDHLGGSSYALKLLVYILILRKILQIILEVPTGALGDHIGRKQTVVLCFVCNAICFLLLAWLYFISSIKISLILVAIAEIFFALHSTLMSGSFVAWVVDSVREKNIQEGHGPILSRSYTVMFVMQIVGAALGLSLYLFEGMFLAFLLGVSSSLLCTVYCAFFMKETQTQHFYQGKLFLESSINRMKEIITQGFKITFGIMPVLYLLLIDIAYVCLNFIVSALWPVAMKVNFGAGKMSPMWYVIVFSALGFATLGSKAAEKVNHRYAAPSLKMSSNASLWLWLVGAAILVGSTVVSLGISSIKAQMPLLLFMATILVCKFGYGFISPIFDTLLNNYIPTEHSKERATIMSFGGMFIYLVTAIVLFFSSGSSDKDIAIGWILPGGLLILSVLVLHVFMRRYQRRFGEIPSKALAPVTLQIEEGFYGEKIN